MSEGTSTRELLIAEIIERKPPEHSIHFEIGFNYALDCIQESQVLSSAADE